MSKKSYKETIKRIFLKSSPQAFINKHPVILWVTYLFFVIHFVIDLLFPSFFENLKSKVFFNYELTYIPPADVYDPPVRNFAYYLKNNGTKTITIISQKIIKECSEYNIHDSLILKKKYDIDGGSNVFIDTDFTPPCWYPFSQTDLEYLYRVKNHIPLCEILISVELKFIIDSHIQIKKFDYGKVQYMESCDKAVLELIANKEITLYD